MSVLEAPASRTAAAPGTCPACGQAPPGPAPDLAVRGWLMAAATVASKQPSAGRAIRAALAALDRAPQAEQAWQSAECGTGRSPSLALTLGRRYTTASQVAASARWAAGVDLP